MENEKNYLEYLAELMISVAAFSMVGYNSARYSR